MRHEDGYRFRVGWPFSRLTGGNAAPPSPWPFRHRWAGVVAALGLVALLVLLAVLWLSSI